MHEKLKITKKNAQLVAMFYYGGTAMDVCISRLGVLQTQAMTNLFSSF